VSDVELLLLGSGVGFAGTTVGSILVDYAVVRRQTRVEILRDVLPSLKSLQRAQRETAVQALLKLGHLLSRRDQRSINRLSTAWRPVDNEFTKLLHRRLMPPWAFSKWF
jgi:hypothetical protein